MPNLKPFAQCGLAAVTAAILAGPVQASGFRVPEISAAGLGTSNALVANTTEPGALPYNPAAMSFHQGNQLVAGVTLIGPDTSVTIGGTTTDSVGKDTFVVPNAYFMGDLKNGWTWGLSINAPFGLETRWPAGTFTVLGSNAPELSRIEMLNFNPNVSRKIGPHTSVAFGLDFYQVREVALNTLGTAIGGSGEGVGFNLAVMHSAGPWTFGGSYRSSVTTDIEGNAGASPASTSVEFPALIQVGAAYRVNDDVQVEFDIDWTGWSSFDKTEIDIALAPNVTSTNNWDDATAYRLGLTWQVSDRTQLRFGYSYDATPQPDEWFSARVPDNDRQLFSVGIKQDMGGWAIEAGYMYVTVDDRTINSTKLPAPEPNGSLAYNGKYETTVNLLAIGITKSF